MMEKLLVGWFGEEIPKDGSGHQALKDWIHIASVSQIDETREWRTWITLELRALDYFEKLAFWKCEIWVIRFAFEMNFNFVLQYSHHKPDQRLGSIMKNYHSSIVDSRFWFGWLIIPGEEQFLSVSLNLTDEGVVIYALLCNGALQGYPIPAHIAEAPLVCYELLHVFFLNA